jgi:hypothetical protein
MSEATSAWPNRLGGIPTTKDYVVLVEHLLNEKEISGQP